MRRLPSVLWLIGFVGVVSLIATVWWLADDTVRTPARSPVTADGAEVPIEAAPSRRAAPDTTPTPLHLPPAADGAASAEDGPDKTVPIGLVRLVGRVVQAGGEGLAGARLTAHPGAGALQAAGYVQPWRIDPPDALLPEVETDGEGRYRVEVAALPPRRAGATPQERLGSSSSVQVQLIVACDGWASREFQCDMSPGPDRLLEVPDIELVRPGLITGRVSTDDDLPLAGAVVKLSSWQANPPPGGGRVRTGRALSATTGADGHFELGGVWPGKGRLELSWGDQKHHTLPSLELGAGETVEVETVRFERGGRLSGRVLDELGRPLEHVSVFVSNQTPHPGMPEGTLPNKFCALGNTDATGRFAADGLNAPTYDIYALAAWRPPTVLPDIECGAEGITVRMSSYGALDLDVVRAADGARVAEARVLARRTPAKSPFMGDRGKPSTTPSTVERMAPGRFRLTAAGPHGTDVVVSAPGLATTWSRLPAVPPGGTGAVSVTLEPQALLELIVEDQHGQPVPGATIHAFPEADERVPWLSTGATTGEQGHATVSGLGAGRWSLIAIAEGVGHRAPSSVTVQPGTPTTERVRLEPPARIVGRVQAAEPVGLLVYLVPSTQVPFEPRRQLLWMKPGGLFVGGYLTTTTGDDGAFLFPHVVAGTYELRSRSVPQIVSISDGETREVLLDSTQAPRLMGRVMTGGRPIPRAEVVAWGLAGRLATTTNEQGRYELSCGAPGSVEVSVRLPDGRGDMIGEVLELSPGELRVHDKHFDPGRIVLTVTWDDGQPAEGVRIRPMPESGSISWLKSWITDAEGRLELDCLRSGRWKVTAEHPAGSKAVGTVVLTDDAPDSQLELILGEPTQATLTGTVRAPNGALAKDGIRIEVLGPWPHWATTKDGVFRCTNLAPGTYRVTAAESILKQEILAEQTVEITGAGNHEVVLHLRAASKPR